MLKSSFTSGSRFIFYFPYVNAFFYFAAGKIFFCRAGLQIPSGKFC
ncbi:Uncharacterized protein dnm_030340 [Desulfonema magnum]|uniref:Uncharacterized protein n=1 Tax=Desulfonema magnum TaxID=45655 RepID=A0A975BJZ7_9BACT|nr:Uncharacterized protein dnm_030340 [Desulfonema magnum]